MKKLMLVILLGGFLFTSCQKDDLTSQTDLEAVEGRSSNNGRNGNNENNGNNGNTGLSDFNMDNEACPATKVAELYAGQNTLVGKVTVEADNGEYIITYSVDPGYCLTETHLQVGADANAFPLKGNGNLANGNFEYGDDPLDCVSSVTYRVPNTGLFIAAHAVVKCVDDYGIIDNLPATASFSTGATAYPGTLGGYFDIEISGGTALDGTYEGWCANVKKPLDPNQGPFSSSVFSTYANQDYPGINEDNFDLVNWLINNKDAYIGEDSPTGGIYNFGDVQWAIWKLLNDAGCVTCAGLGDKADLERKGNEIAADVLQNQEAEGFVPGCDQLALVILIPDDTTKQPVMIPVPIDCEAGDCEETAWARNDSNRDCGNFPGGNWATYFKYDDK
ncbi:hypothetical protein [Robiginitalea aurantiaca]|uniref:Uncharacterized protein n=1 Tax=Robiginitalea aurantiaca TaxID=3056915 RepID=A0ABT7WH20_9FLAO|nr:hypothetical protein [Robiginitalea aurantiaca]MDM9632221.1 hypothetical protein [Robiginitalea aurantiaca]